MTKLGDYVLSGQEINSNVVRSIDGVGGGGGESDFSEAIITIENTNNSAYDPLDHAEINYPSVYNDNYVNVASIPIDNDPVAIKIALYKGAAICYDYNFINNIAVFEPAPGSPSSPDVSGDIECVYDDEEAAWIYTITGDCTIRVGSEK